MESVGHDLLQWMAAMKESSGDDDGAGREEGEGEES
jgi:hypothetical protein